MKIKDLAYYVVIFILVIAAKISYSYATNDSLLFVLKPLSTIISFVIDDNPIYSNELGFYFENLNIIIDKSCSGVNFWIICFSMFSVAILKITTSNLKRVLVIFTVLLASFLFTLFANTSRILTSILIAKQSTLDYPWLHQAEGVFIYTSLLILAYTIFNYIISKYQNHYAKLT